MLTWATTLFGWARTPGRTALSLFILAVGAGFAAAAPTPGGGAAAAPLPLSAEHPDFYQRVLTLPGARLYTAPDGSRDAARPLPVFSIFYVFERREMNGREWLAIGTEVNGRAQGWTPGDLAEAWNSMLVMQFAPAGQREQVLFFRERAALDDLLKSPRLTSSAFGLLDSIESGRPDDRLLAYESEGGRVGGVSFSDQPYVLPIIDHQETTMDDGTPETLLQVASVNAEAAPRSEVAPERTREALGDFSVGVTFVIDTTISMQPYIDAVEAEVARLARSLERSSAGSQISFGLVGYRNNVDAAASSGLDYTRRVYLPLRAGANARDLTAALGRMQEAPVSTHSFDEDLVAGLDVALSDIERNRFDSNHMIVVTDAGPLPLSDPYRMLPNESISTIANRADLAETAVYVLHLATPAAQRVGNVEGAARAFGPLARTGDPNAVKYVRIEGGDVSSMVRQVAGAANRLSGNVVESVETAEPVEKPEIQSEEPNLGDLMVNEIFRAQQKLIGAVEGADAPQILRGWAIDKDLTAPQRTTMRVGVLLTRNQINDLAQRLAQVLEIARAARLTPEKLFEELQALAANTAGDPALTDARNASIQELGLLPSYLELLPYDPPILQLDENRWLSATSAEQTFFIEEMDFKVESYRDIQSNTNKWFVRGGDGGEDLYPMPLRLLP
ncbi:MAG: vWA domain-containing protein [Nitratireductor sp.]